MPTVHKRPAARRDLVARYVYFFEHANPAVAERFLANIEASLSDLAHRPRMGAPAGMRHPKLLQLRKWQVRGFDDILIFYLPRADGISVVRVLRVAQDWRQLIDVKASPSS